MINISNQITEGLICVRCKNSLVHFSANGILCEMCQQWYPVINGIPVILNESESIFKFSDFTDYKNLFFDISKNGKLISLISKIMPSIGWNIPAKRNFKILEEKLVQGGATLKPRVLVVGGSIIGEGMFDFVKSRRLNIVEGDVSHGPQTKIIFDSHSIPYKNESFDGVVIQAVLEHVTNPIGCVSELYRILKPNGFVYAETPFMQQVHGGAYDFTRFTRSGHRKLFQNFNEVKSGISAGSATVLAWSYEYFLLALFGHTSMLRLMVKFFARLTGFWIKYFDYLTRLNDRDADGASGFYYIGQKTKESIKDKELIEYYFKK